MQTIAIEQAPDSLAELVETLPADQEVVLTRSGAPVAAIRLISPPAPRAPRRLGTLKGSILSIAPDFDDIPEGFEEYLP